MKIFSRTRPGVELIRGAAGSGKTTTALLKLRSLIAFFVSRRRRTGSTSPIRVLVLTYNRTLKGYINELARSQIKSSDPVILEVETFARWSHQSLGYPKLLEGDGTGRAKIISLGSRLPFTPGFLADEVDYLSGRFLPADLTKYLTSRREGRGASPRVERPTRQQILTDIVAPFTAWKVAQQAKDWNDLAVELAVNKVNNPYDIVIADETQDFSANQVRAILNQLQPDHSVTFVLDSAQRIYPRGFNWAEVGLTIVGDMSKRLTINYRNSVEIASLAASIVSGLDVDDDGSIPSPSSCARNGAKPIVVVGRFSQQLSFAITHIKASVDLEAESVAFLHPKGWFDEVRAALTRNNLGFVELTRKSEWPMGTSNIALSTLHSAKGLEFDHIVVLGLNAETTQHGTDADDDSLAMLRRLLAMGIGRARSTVLLGYKAEQASQLISYIDSSTYVEIIL